VAVWLSTEAHHGTGKLGVRPPAGKLQQVILCQTCAQGFNPLATPTDESPDASLAIDNNVNTSWDTQQYYDDKLDKAGTGIYVNASPDTTARYLQIIDSTPGFTATIYARDSRPPLLAPPGNGWTQVSAPTTIGAKASIPLTSGATPYSYFLVWITSLGGHEQLSLAEITLYRSVAAGG
jgi:hypothetical protein